MDLLNLLTGLHATHQAEVFSIKINKINDGSEKCEVCGTIRVEDKDGTLYLYSRYPEDAECVYPNSTLSLIGPRERPISASSNFKVYIDLKDKSGNEFISNSFCVDLRCIDDTPVNGKCRSAAVEGKMGVATVTYAVVQLAILACTRAAIINENDSSNSDGDCAVYGRLVAHYGKFGMKEDTRIVLFDSTSEMPVLLKKEKCYEIPLSRSFVVVPVYSSLIYEGDIYCCYSDGRTEVIKIYEEIQARDIDIITKTIEGRIKIRVFWRPTFKYRSYRDHILGRPETFSMLERRERVNLVQ